MKNGHFKFAVTKNPYMCATDLFAIRKALDTFEANSEQLKIIQSYSVFVHFINDDIYQE